MPSFHWRKWQTRLPLTFPVKSPKATSRCFHLKAKWRWCFSSRTPSCRTIDSLKKLVHKTIDRLPDLRIRQNREFFNVAPQIALDIFKDIAQTIDDAIVTEYRDNKPFKQYSMNDEDNDNTHDEEGETIPSPKPPKPPKKDDSNSAWSALRSARFLLLFQPG